MDKEKNMELVLSAPASFLLFAGKLRLFVKTNVTKHLRMWSWGPIGSPFKGALLIGQTPDPRPQISSFIHFLHVFNTFYIEMDGFCV